MKIILLVVGKTDAGCWREALENYSRRLGRYAPFETIIIPDLKNAGSLPETLQKEREGQLILQSIKAGDCCVLLDERGKEYTSKQFAAYIGRKMQEAKRLVFVVGGPYGFSQEVYETIPERISLSKMTFSHQMIRPVFVEQLYRAMTILRGEPYHHE